MSQVEMSDEDMIEEMDTTGEEKSSEIARFKILIYGADFTLEVLYNKLEQGEIVIPPFQRRYIWSIKKASRLIESFLLGLPVPQIFLYREEKQQDLLVVDGHQRLKTIQFFINEKFENNSTFHLRGVKSKWEGKKFSDLTNVEKRALKNSILRAVIFEQADPRDMSSMYEIFDRLNTGGMQLSSQEIRNCLIRGEIRDFLKQLNKYERWRYLLGRKQPNKRMKDIELILRFFALRENWRLYKKNMKEFLNSYMKTNKNISQSKQEKYERLFKELIDKIGDEVGFRAFRLKRGVNSAVFDSVMVALSEIGVDKVENFEEKYDKLLENEKYKEYVSKSTTDVDRVKGRIKIAIETFSK